MPEKPHGDGVCGTAALGCVPPKAEDPRLTSTSGRTQPRAAVPHSRQPVALEPSPWTDAQLRGIRTTGRSLLVSAAAGSGKTAMLAARCAYLVCDAPDHCDVDDLLVVTFTEAAAAQMKQRIHAALRDRAAATSSQRLRRQLALIDHASVSTLHAFCAKLLREHFHAVGLDPTFTVMSGEEAALVRREVARALFDDRYELDPDGAFERFVDAYGEGDDASLVRRVIGIHEMLCSLADPAAWLRRSHERIAQASEAPLHESDLGRELLELLSRGIGEMRQQCDAAIALVRKLERFPKYVEDLIGCGQTLRHWQETLNEYGLNALAEVATLQLPALPKVANSVPAKEIAKGAVDAVRTGIKEGAWRDLLRFTSAEWQEGLRAIAPHAKTLLGLVEEFASRYRLAKDSGRVVDFSDLERFTLQVLSERTRDGRLRPSPAARAYHKRFKHVLVDEYQDINEVQDAILSMLSRECVWDAPGQSGNLFCVGDVKQSIYRFRLAEAGRFLDRQRLFRADTFHRHGEVIDLQSNFRSRGPLLDAINGLFERLMTAAAVDIEYDASQRLHAGLVYPEADRELCFAGAPIELHLLPAEQRGESEEAAADASDSIELDRSEREALLVAQRIRQLTGLDGSPPMSVVEKDGAGEMHPRPIRFGDIVILLRSVRYKSQQYADILRRCGIPVHAQSGTGYFESTEIRDMLAFLTVLENQRRDIPLAAVLRSPLANLPEPENSMARIRRAFPAAGDDAVPFHDAVVRYAQEKQDPLALWLRDFLAQLEQWRQAAHSRPLPELIRTIYDETGYLAFCAGLHDGQQRVANLRDLHERARQFGGSRRRGLAQFLQFLESLDEEEELGQPSIASEADDVVRVMSIHRSKGLEFPVVVVPDLGKRINFSDCHGPIVADRSAGLGLSVVDPERMIRYPSLASVLVQRRLKQQALAEEMRILYVALTRAKEHLILVGTCGAQRPQAWEARWSTHRGAMPAETILSAKCMLDWIGPAAAAAAGAGEPIIQLTQPSPEQIASWQAEHARRPALSTRQAELAALTPLDSPPASDPAADEVIGRLQYRYPFEPLTRLAATAAVTSQTKAAGPVRGLPRPRFLAEQVMSAADVGTATHLVLFHLDFRRPCDAADLSEQITLMVERKRISSQQAEAVKLDSILWLLESEIGAQLRAHAADLRRELPIHLACPADCIIEASDPLDCAMLRGRIDALICAPGGAILIDYKTDSISSSAVAERAEDYKPQLTEYGRAVERITGLPLAGRYLIFLVPRVICAV